MPQTSENPQIDYTPELELQLEQRRDCGQCGVEGLYLGEVAVGLWLPVQLHVCTNAERARFAASGGSAGRGACKGCGATESQQQPFMWRHHPDFTGARHARLVFIHVCKDSQPRKLRVLSSD